MTSDEFKKKYLKETYLGDGLYASFNGHCIILRAPRQAGDDYICLEPSVFDTLLLYRDKIYKDAEKIK